jgi:hypothetical protein
MSFEEPAAGCAFEIAERFEQQQPSEGDNVSNGYSDMHVALGEYLGCPWHSGRIAGLVAHDVNNDF